MEDSSLEELSVRAGRGEMLFPAGVRLQQSTDECLTTMRAER